MGRKLEICRYFSACRRATRQPSLPTGGHGLVGCQPEKTVLPPFRVCALWLRKGQGAPLLCTRGTAPLVCGVIPSRPRYSGHVKRRQCVTAYRRAHLETGMPTFPMSCSYFTPICLFCQPLLQEFIGFFYTSHAVLGTREGGKRGENSYLG